MQSVVGAILREYVAITLQEIGLRNAARSLRGGPAASANRRKVANVSGPVKIESMGEPGLAGANPFLVETGSELQLQFAKSVLQSRMRFDDPDALVAPYTRQMMSFLLFNPEPEHILMIGLGGGSMAKFCYRHLPHARISVVEIDARVIAMRESFRVPADDERLHVIHDDGVRYVSQLHEPVDVILIDAFDENGVAPSLARSNFYADAWRQLRDEGVLVMNLLGAPQSYAMHIERVREVVDRVLLVTVTGNDNVLLFACKPAVISPNAPQLPLRARYLQSRFRLNFRNYLQKLREAAVL